MTTRRATPSAARPVARSSLTTDRCTFASKNTRDETRRLKSRLGFILRLEGGILSRLFASARHGGGSVAATDKGTRLIDIDQLVASRGEHGWSYNQEASMKQISVKRAILAAAVLACGTFGSIEWSKDNGLSMSIETAKARVGRPGTPVSVAGVARRTTRRAVVGGAAVGAAAAGTACVRVLVNGAYVCR